MLCICNIYLKKYERGLFSKRSSLTPYINNFKEVYLLRDFYQKNRVSYINTFNLSI